MGVGKLAQLAALECGGSRRRLEPLGVLDALAKARTPLGRDRNGSGGKSEQDQYGGSS